MYLSDGFKHTEQTQDSQTAGNRINRQRKMKIISLENEVEQTHHNKHWKRTQKKSRMLFKRWQNLFVGFFVPVQWPRYSRLNIHNLTYRINNSIISVRQSCENESMRLRWIHHFALCGRILLCNFFFRIAIHWFHLSSIRIAHTPNPFRSHRSHRFWWFCSHFHNMISVRSIYHRRSQ